MVAPKETRLLQINKCGSVCVAPMNICHGLAEVVLRVDHAGSEATLPQPTEIAVPFIELPGDVGLEPQHRPPEENGAGLDDEVVMVTHQGPGEDLPSMEVAQLSDGRNELLRLERIVENELAACDVTMDVVCGSRNEKARVSWHEIAPMRGRDTLILVPQSQDATMQ
jgi:hypothetical protein